MVFQSLDDARNYVLSNDEDYFIKDELIRGVSFTVFKNGPKLVPDILNLCLNHKEKDFLVFDEERYSFGEFHELTCQIAYLLINEYNIRPGDRVAILMKNSPEFPLIFIALASIGAVAVCLNSWWTAAELEYGFMDSEPKLVFTDEQRLEKIRGFVPKLGLKTVLCRHRDSSKSDEFWSAVLAIEQNQLPKIDIDQDSDFAVMYTSGSTGHPKGVVMTHRGAISTLMSWHFGLRVLDAMGLGPVPYTDKNGQPYQPCQLVSVPFFHVSGTHGGVLLALWSGTKLVIMKKWDPPEAVRLMETEKVSRFGGVPTMAAEIIEEAKKVGAKLDSIRLIDTGGANRPADQAKEMADFIPHVLTGTSYGMTETNALGIAIRGKEYLENPKVTGRLIAPLAEMRIVDEFDVDVAVGEVGELVLKSAANMRCYLNKDIETSEVLKNGWLYTGDLAKIDENQLITLVDRKKNIIIRGGENISAQEVQTAILEHPDVVEAAIFSLPNERLGEIVGACVYCRKTSHENESSLQDFLKSSLAAYKIPEHIWIKNKPLPRVASEKIDVEALKKEYS